MVEASRVGRTLTRMLLDRAESAADRVALTMLGTNLHRPCGAVQRRGPGTRALDVNHGDVVAVLTENSLDHMLVQFATARLGALEVMLNTAYRGEFLAHQLSVSGARVIVVDAHLLAPLLQLAHRLPALRHILVRGEAVDSTDRSLVGPRVRVAPIAELHDHPSTSLSEVRDPSWTDPSTIAFTSGTTGPSKGTVLSQNYLCTFAEVESSIWYRGPRDCFYSCGPLFHLAAKGIAVPGALHRGVRCVQDERFSVSTFWSRIREEGCTATLMLGSMMMLLWARHTSAHENVGTIVAVPAPPELLHGAMERRWGATIEGVYGLSEAAPLTRSKPGSPLRPGSAGTIVDEYFQVRVVDGDDVECPPGRVGEVVVRPRRPHAMFEGYHREPQATLDKFRNLWFHTGDLGRFDVDDYFYFVDRVDDYLRRRGENISSHEVEAAIAQHPAVIEAAVVGVPSELTEQEVKATVILRAGSNLTHTDLIEHCITAMPYFAVPRYVQFVADLPRTPSGKVEKHRLRETGATDCWDREAAGIVLSGKRTNQVHSHDPTT